eukprot:403368723
MSTSNDTGLVRNMGRFFLMILGLQTIDKSLILIQELAFPDLSQVYYEIRVGIYPRSLVTELCQSFGLIKTFIDFLSQFYALWLAVLIKQILKDPIHKINRYIIFYHALTFFISTILTFMMSLSNQFGVEESIQCGIMHEPDSDDEILMLLPFILVPIEIYLISKIMKQTPFIVKQTLKKFVTKYTLYLVCLMSMQCMQVMLVLFGSRKNKYFQYDEEDGYKYLRYTYLFGDKITFLCLAISTLCEPIIITQDKHFYQQRLLQRKSKKKYRQPKIKVRINKQCMQVILKNHNTRNNKYFQEHEEDAQKCRSQIKKIQEEVQTAKNQNSQSVSSEDDFEMGDNQARELREESQFVEEDQSKFQKLVDVNDDTFGIKTTRMTMTLEQKTNYFIINTVLMSICECLLMKQKVQNQNVVGVVGGILKLAQAALTYQLQDNDINYIMDIADFFQKNQDLCVADITNGKKVQVKITEYGPDLFKQIRKSSGFQEDFLINTFSPKSNSQEMTQFQEGSGKSASLFFFTNNKNFVIKTLKQGELDLLVKRGLLEKYYSYIQKHPKTLLARFYGIYTIKIKYMKSINVIIMDNLMGQNIEEATRMYDLKGSTFQRIVMNPRSAWQTRKDINYIEDVDYRMLVNKKIQKDLHNRMRKDKEFLKSCDLMDYSLLLVFFKKTKIESHSPQNWQGSTPPQNFGDFSTKNRKMSIFMKYTNEGKFLCVEEQDKSGDNLLNSPEEKNHPFMRTQSMNFPNLHQISIKEKFLKIQQLKDQLLAEPLHQVDSRVIQSLSIRSFYPAI